MTGFAWRSGHLALDLAHGHVLFTTRRGGVSEGSYASLNVGANTEDDPDRVRRNRARVAALAGADGLVAGRQVHGMRVVVDGAGGEEADAQVVTRRGAAALVSVADCLPVALVAPGAVAMVHAGWRGLAGGILAAAVTAVRAAASDLPEVVAALGPAAGGCCYEVGDDVRAVFGTTGPTLDLAAIAAGQLAAAGVGEVHATALCTMCARDGAGERVFFSHRGEGGVTGRQAGLAWRR